MDIAECRSCGRKIIWTTSPTGARLPLDARPVTVYRFVRVPESETPDAIKVALGDNVFVSHFLTCPNAQQHSRGGRA